VVLVELGLGKLQISVGNFHLVYLLVIRGISLQFL
jgi:hypothetical protein